GLRRLAVAALLEAVDQLAKSAAEYATGRRAAEVAAQLLQHAGQTAGLSTVRSRLSGSLSAGLSTGGPPACRGRRLPASAEPFGDLVSVLVAGHSQQSQQGRHGRESTAHRVAPPSCTKQTGRWSRRYTRRPDQTLPAPRDQPPNHKNDDGADDRANQAGPFIGAVPAD